MKNKIKLTVMGLCTALVLSGCAENKLVTSAAESSDSETAAATTASDTKELTTTADETSETTAEESAMSEVTSDTTQPRVPDERLSLSLEADQSGPGEQFARVYKLTNTSSGTIEDMHDKILDFREFDEAEQLVLNYDNNDTVVVEWNKGDPDWENAERYFDAQTESNYKTHDEVLLADETVSITAYNFGSEADYFTATGTDPEETAAVTTAATTLKPKETTPQVTPEALPNPVMDESIFTLYIGGGETCEKYDVKVDALPADILKTVIGDLQGDGVLIAIDKDGKYSLLDPDEADMLSVLIETEMRISREFFEDLKQYITDPEYADITYEEYRSLMLNTLEMVYPGVSEKFDENGKLKEPDTTVEYIGISYYNENNDISPYCDSETVIKEGLNAAFADLDNSKERAAMLKEGKPVYNEIVLRYYGGYVLSYDTGSSTLTGNRASTSGSVYLGKAKAYEKEPTMLTRQVFSPKSEALKYINTDDSPYELTIEILSEGYIADAISVKRSGYANVMSNDAILGEIPEITFYGHDDFNEEAIKEVWVEFRIKDGYRDNVLGTYAAEEPELEGIGRLNIFMYFTDGNMTLPIQTYIDRDNCTVYTVTDSVGTYCLYDLEMWLDMLNIPPQ